MADFIQEIAKELAGAVSSDLIELIEIAAHAELGASFQPLDVSPGWNCGMFLDSKFEFKTKRLPDSLLPNSSSMAKRGKSSYMSLPSFFGFPGAFKTDSV